MSKTVKYLRKIAVALVGFPIVILGIILIPLPGPGILVSLLGLLILSTEFEWSKKYVDMAKASLKRVMDTAKAKSTAIEAKAEQKEAQKKKK